MFLEWKCDFNERNSKGKICFNINNLNDNFESLRPDLKCNNKSLWRFWETVFSQKSHENTEKCDSLKYDVKCINIFCGGFENGFE